MWWEMHFLIEEADQNYTKNDSYFESIEVNQNNIEEERKSLKKSRGKLGIELYKFI